MPATHSTMRRRRTSDASTFTNRSISTFSNDSAPEIPAGSTSNTRKPVMERNEETGFMAGMVWIFNHADMDVSMYRIASEADYADLVELWAKIDGYLARGPFGEGAEYFKAAALGLEGNRQFVRELELKRAGSCRNGKRLIDQHLSILREVLRVQEAIDKKTKYWKEDLRKEANAAKRRKKAGRAIYKFDEFQAQGRKVREWAQWKQSQFEEAGMWIDEEETAILNRMI